MFALYPTDSSYQYNICVELLNQRKEVVQRFAPETVYIAYYGYEEWSQVREKDRRKKKSTHFLLKSTELLKAQDNSGSPDYVSDDSRVSKLRTCCKVHSIYPRRQRYADYERFGLESV